MERGKGEHGEYLDSLAKNGVLDEIKKHEYIQTSGAACSINVNLFRRNYSLSLCEWEDKIRLFGRIIFSITGLGGLLLVLRR